MPDKQKRSTAAVSAILLAGGKSSRMGTDKGALPFDGRPMLEHQIAKLKGLGVGEIIVSGRSADTSGTRCVMDEYTGRGPLGGLHACLSAARFPDCLILSVDMPLVPEETLRVLLSAHFAGEQSITLLTLGDRPEPLPAVCRRELAPVAARLLETGDGSLRSLLREAPFRLLPYRGARELLMNCNTPEEYRRALAIAEARGQKGAEGGAT